MDKIGNISHRLSLRPTKGKIIIPFMVDESKDPIDFKAVDAKHVEQCAREQLCGVCGTKMRPGHDRYAFLGPLRDLKCFGDPWMHVECADYVQQFCPFVSGKRRLYREGSNELLKVHEGAWMLVIAKSGKTHRDELAWHFEPVGVKQSVALSERKP